MALIGETQVISQSRVRAGESSGQGERVNSIRKLSARGGVCQGECVTTGRGMSWPGAWSQDPDFLSSSLTLFCTCWVALVKLLDLSAGE